VEAGKGVHICRNADYQKKHCEDQERKDRLAHLTTMRHLSYNSTSTPAVILADVPGNGGGASPFRQIKKDGSYLSMAGKVSTRERCPKCGQKFQFIGEADILCTSCHTKPETFYIYLYWPDEYLGRDHKIPHDTDGNALDSFRRAHRLLEKIRNEIDSGTFILRNYLRKERNQFRGRILFPRWLAFIKSKKRSLNYTRKLEQYVKDYFTPLLGEKDCTQLKTSDISKVRSFLLGELIRKQCEECELATTCVYCKEGYRIKAGNHKGGLLAPKAVKNIMDQAKSFCKWLMREELIVRMPIFDSVEVPEQLPTIMPIEDRNKALAAIRSPRLKAAITFYVYHPAMRPSEVAALDVRHFDLSYRCVKIAHGLDYDRSIKTRKNKKEYVMPLSKHWDDSCIRGRFGNEIAFPNKDGGRYNAHTLNEGWRTACKSAGVPYVNIYNAMKHTGMTEMARNGASTKQLQTIAGQSSAKSQERYIALSVESVRHLVDGSIGEVPGIVQVKDKVTEN